MLTIRTHISAALVKKIKKSLRFMSNRKSKIRGQPDSVNRINTSKTNGQHATLGTNTKASQFICSNAPFQQNDGSGKFKFIDLFAGIGGIRIPFQEIGGECVFSSEWDKFSKKTYCANFGIEPEGDLTKINAADIPPHDLLLAGFPCQAFSQAGLKQGFHDTRGTMFFEIQRILAHRRPRAFLLENVKQLKGHDSGRTLRTILDILSGKNIPKVPKSIPITKEARKSLSTRLNYDVAYTILRATDFGLPQKRERIYIIGLDRELYDDGTAQNILDRITKAKTKPKLGNILEKLDPPTRAKYTISDKLWAGHMRRKANHRNKGNGFGYSLFNADAPYCNTISARYYKDGSEILIDQTEFNENPRKLTPRECARIQGFPEIFKLDQVSDAQCYKQFGNTVSIPVIRAIAEGMKKFLIRKISKSGNC